MNEKNTEKIILRSMTEEDLPAVEQLEKTCFSQPWSADGFATALSRKENIFLVAVKEEGNKKPENFDATSEFPENRENGKDAQECFSPRILGYVGMYVALDEGEITNVAVDPIFRGQGIGKLLLEELFFRARKNRLSSIVLEVRASNTGAIALYTAMGFVDLGIRKNFYEFPTEDARIMQCLL